MPRPRPFSGLCAPRPARGQGREALLCAAEALVREDGFATLSVERVARRAQVSKGAFFHHFATRQAMVEALLEHLAVDFDAQLIERAAPGRPFAAVLIETLLAEAEQDGAFMAAMLSAVVLDRSLAQAMDARIAQWTQRMVDDGLDEATALLVRSALDGVVLLCVLHAPHPVPARELGLIRGRLLALVEP